MTARLLRDQATDAKFLHARTASDHFFLTLFRWFGYACHRAGNGRNPSRIIALIDVCVLGVVPRALCGNLGRFLWRVWSRARRGINQVLRRIEYNE